MNSLYTKHKGKKVVKSGEEKEQKKNVNKNESKATKDHHHIPYEC